MLEFADCRAGQRVHLGEEFLGAREIAAMQGEVGCADQQLQVVAGVVDVVAESGVLEKRFEGSQAFCLLAGAAPVAGARVLQCATQLVGLGTQLIGHRQASFDQFGRTVVVVAQPG